MTVALKFTAHYGDETKQVEVSQAVNGGEGYNILIDQWYHGALYKRGSRWDMYVNEKSDLTTADLMILTDMIDEALKKENEDKLPS